MRIISRSIADIQDFSNNSFTYILENIQLVNFQIVANYWPTQNE